MRTTRPSILSSSIRPATFAAALALVVAGHTAMAVNYYWDGGVANNFDPGDGVSQGGVGNWDFFTSNWDDGSSHVVWPLDGVENDAVFGGTAGIVTLTTSLPARNLSFNTTGYTLASGGGSVLTLDNSTIVTGTGVSTTISAPITGTSVTKAGNGTLTLSGANTYTGTTIISSGIVKLGNVSALGTQTGALDGTTIASGATLDLAGLNGGVNSSTGTERITVSGAGVGGNGAIISSTAIPTPFLGVRYVTLAGDTTLGFTTRWDIGSNTGALPSEVIGGGFTLNLIGSGAGQASLNFLGETGLGDININLGGNLVTNIVFLQGSTTLGDPTKTVTVTGGSTLHFFTNALASYDKKIALNNGNLRMQRTGGATLAGTISLVNDNSIIASTPIAVPNVVSGTGTLTLSGGTGVGTTFTAANTYSGAVSLISGTSRVGGALGSLANVSAMNLAGAIFINGDATAATNTSVTNRINPAIPLNLGGATFTMVGGGAAGATAHSQTFTGLVVNRGGSTINSVSTVAGTQVANLTFAGGADGYVRNAGGVLSVATPAGGFTVSFTAAPTGASVAGGVLAGATLNTNDFIAAGAGVLAPPTYTNDMWAPNTQTNITTSAAFGGTTGSVRFITAAASTLTLNAGTNIVSSGNILIGATVGNTNATTITGGDLTTGNGSGLIVFQGNGAVIANTTIAFPAALNLNARLTNNGATSVGFTKTGPGVVIFGGTLANTYTGPTTVLGSGTNTNYAPLILSKPDGVNAIGGDLSIGSAGGGFSGVYLGASNQIPDSSVVSFAGSSGNFAYFQMQGRNETIAGLSDNTAAGVVENMEAQVINTDSTLTLGGSGTYSFNGFMRNRSGGAGTGVLTLVKNGSGTQALAGANILYTGTTTVNNGTLALSGTTANVSPVVFPTGVTARLRVDTNSQIGGLSTGDANTANVIVSNGVGVSSVLTINQAANTTFGGRFQDNPDQTIPSTFGFTKAGVGTLILPNDNTYSGPTTVGASSVLDVRSSGALGSTVGGTTVAGNGAIYLQGNLAIGAEALTIGGGGIVNAGALRVISGSNSWAGPITLTGATRFTVDSGMLTVNAISGTNTNLVLNGNGDIVVNGVIGTGTGGVNKDTFGVGGAGNVLLAGANTYTGLTSVGSGIMTLTGNRTAASGPITVGSAGNAATLNIQNGTFTVGGTGVFTVGTGDATSSGTVNQTAGALTLSGTTQLIVGNGGLTVGNASTGTYNLSGGSLTGAASGTRGVILGVNIGNTGIFNLTGSATLAMGSSNMQVGRSDSPVLGSTGIFNQTGVGSTATIGTLTVGGGAGAAFLNTTGTLNLQAGTFTANAFTLLGAADGSVSTITIGGTSYVTLPAFPTGRGAGAVVNLTFDGGTLAPLAPSTNYMSGLSNASVTNNGAKLDVGAGNDITIAQTLSNAPEVSGAVTKLGNGVLTLSGAQNYSTLNANAGITNVDGAFSGGTSTVNANAATNFRASQTLAALNIADGVVVTLAEPPLASPGFESAGELLAGAPVQPVPEPGIAASLLCGLGVIFGLRRCREA